MTGIRQRSSACESLDVPAVDMSKKLNVPIIDGKVNGKQVKIMRDTGSSTSAVRAALVTKSQYIPHYEDVLLMDGTSRRYQKARVSLECEYYTGTVDMMVIADPVVDCILGNLKSMKPRKTKGGIG